LGNEANKKVNTLDMPQEATYSVKARTMRTRDILNQQGMQRGSHSKKKTPKAPRKQQPKQTPPYPKKKEGTKTFLAL